MWNVILLATALFAHPTEVHFTTSTSPSLEGHGMALAGEMIEQIREHGGYDLIDSSHFSKPGTYEIHALIILDLQPKMILYQVQAGLDFEVWVRDRKNRRVRIWRSGMVTMDVMTTDAILEEVGPRIRLSTEALLLAIDSIDQEVFDNLKLESGILDL